jgi:hypothetical protein
MNLRAEAQFLCLEICDGSRRLNKFGNKTRANMNANTEASIPVAGHVNVICSMCN